MTPDASRRPSAPEAGSGSVSVAEADDQLLEQAESTSTDWDFPGTRQQAPSYTSTALTPSFSEESSEELRRITTIHPRSYNDAKIIGESFRENIPVIMNVTDMGDTDAKRLIDFSAGLAFALNGHIERVTDKVFLLTPANLEVLGAEGTEVPVALDSDDVTPFNQA
ncbi:cell division protein SepF [Rothia sp. L_38]|uniref:cell division protein SepF n=1 Tax=Rothia sp. L_38 TaxID=3422315 RepID=UPI003D6C5642